MIGNRGIAFYIFTGIFCVYFLSWPGNNIDAVDQRQVRFATTLSIVEDGDLSIPDGMGVKGRDGRDYSWYGIGQPVLAVPFYVTGKFMGGEEGAKGMVSMLNLFAVSLSGAVVFLFINTLGYSARAALTVAVFYAFGTIAWPQSKHSFDHPVEMLFVLLAIFFAHLFAEGRGFRYLILSSASLGYAFITRVPAVLALPSIFIYLSFRRIEGGFTAKRGWDALKDCIFYFIAFVPFGLIELWYNYARFGSIFETGITLMAGRAGIDFFTGTPFLTGLSGFLLSPGKGFFFYSPIGILFFFSVKKFYRRERGLAICIMGVILSYLIFLSRNIYWHGDWSWGPRYLLVITPLLMIPTADFVERLLKSGKIALRYSVLVFFGISMGVQIIGISVDPNRYFYSLQVEKGVQFSSVGGNGAPHIYEPPPGIHFEWDKFPIVYQADAALKIWRNLKDYRCVDFTGKNYSLEEALKYLIWFNIFDFWWMNAMYTGATPYGVFTALGLISFIITISWLKVLRMVNE